MGNGPVEKGEKDMKKALIIATTIGLAVSGLCGLIIGYSIGYADGKIVGKTEGYCEGYGDRAKADIKYLLRKR